MKTKCFLPLAFFAVVLTFFACSGDSGSDDPVATPSSNSGTSLCAGEGYDPDIFRCETGELIGKCAGQDYYPAYQQCNNGVVENRNGSSSSSAPDTSGDGSSSSSGGGSSSSNYGSSSSVVIPAAYEFLGGGYNVISSAYINPSDAIKHRSYPVLNREKMFQDDLFATTKQPQENFSTFASNSIKETYHKRNLKIGASVEANLPFLPFFSGGASGEYENVTNSERKQSMSFVKLNYYNYKEDLSIKSATKEKLKDYLTDNFKADLKAKSAVQIIELYGTHIFVQYYRGGSLEANYTYAYDGQADSEAVRKSAGLTFRGIPGVTISGDISTSTNASNLSEEKDLTFTYYSYGGATIGVGDLTALKGKFPSWATSINENNAVICGIADFKSSLIPIWDLASAGGFSTEANALKAAYYSQASNIKFSAARLFKKDIRPAYTKVGTVKESLSYEDGTIAEIEIYALGAGGGGQGGDYTTDWIDDIGTGGAGGGGAATYVKLGNLGLQKNDPISLDITIGKGGSGGAYFNGVTERSGDNGSAGGTTKVVYKDANITALGGSGGGGNSTQTNGGAGGVGSNSNIPNSSNYYIIGSGYFVTGGSGTNGDWKNDIASRGGNAAKITGKGGIPSFGGGLGASRPKGGASPTGSGKGGGGRGGYSKSSGTNGGDGEVNIVVYYFWEDGEAEAKPEDYGIACDSYCKWDTGCNELRTDPDGIYGEAYSSCSEANVICDYYGARYSNATCTGTSLTLSSAKPQSCGGFYCRWDTGCHEIKTDPVGLYGTISSSCTAAISVCDEHGERYDNGDCL